MTAYYRVLAIVLLLLFVGGNASAKDALQVKISLLQKLPDTTAVPVATDTVLVPIDDVLTSQLATIVTDLSVLSHTDTTVELRIEMITSGPNLKNYFRTFNVPFGLPVIVDSVIVKNGSIFRLSISPLGIVDMEVDCDYNPSAEGVFTSDPAPHFQMFFVPYSLGDYHWNAIRSYLEREVDVQYKMYKFAEPHPVSFYLLPCEYPTYRYDKLWGFHVDPVRNNVMCVYNHDEKTVSALPVNMLRFYRFWGYAPRFFVEGISSVSDFNDFYVRNYMTSHSIPALSDYFVTDDYLNSNDKLMLRRFAGSFCAYLVKAYGIQVFKQLYMNLTDLTASDDLFNAYGKSADSLNTEWIYYLDTMKIDSRWFKYYAQREAYLRNYDEVISLLERRYAATDATSDQMEELGNYCFLTGDYDKAKAYYGLRLGEDDVEPSNLVVYANMLLILGDLDDALEFYNKVISLDSTLPIPEYKVGRILQYLNDYTGAIEHFKRAAKISTTDDIVIDAQLGIASCFKAMGDDDSSKAYNVSALNGSKALMIGGSPKPLMYMRAAEAFIALGQADPAIEQLDMALFVEERKFYVGRMALAMGKAYDLKGKRDTALEYYNLVQDAPGGFLFREEADKYITKPYSVNR